MSGRIGLSLVLHNHQPVGNFGWVIAEVCDRAYEPMVGALERHPGIRVGLHYSGPLLEWLATERPVLLDRLRSLVDRRQVEILGGGLDEPVLASLPERDRIGQLSRLADRLESTFGSRPSGAWLAERVWEPDLPTSLVEAGYGWTILDDAHFRAAAVPEDALWGPYTTDDQGRRITVFGTEQGLRYRIPFRPVNEVIEYLRDHATEAGDRVGMMGDDGEKFGGWPSTWEHCWGRGRWVETFFQALEANADWLTTHRPSDWLADHAPIGRVYLPTGSYAEMGEWALPADEARAFTAALHAAQAANAPEARWLRGGFWRNFQVKYREVNDLHKQMLRASNSVAAMPAGDARELATEHLYRGQSNDCYWHGLFGGIYIAHMRAATFAELIAAEDLADAALERQRTAERRDLDLDGRDEARLATDGQVVTVELDEGAGITSWDLRAARHAMTAVLRRRPEAYHAALASTGAAAADAGDTTSSDAGHDEDAVVSIHGAIRAKDPDLGARLRYDAYERRSGLLRALPPDRAPDAWGGGGDDDLGDPAAPMTVSELAPGRLVTVGRAVIAGQPVAVTRTIELGGGRLDPTLRVRIEVEHLGSDPIHARLGQEWATTMLGGGGNPAAWWELDGRRVGHDGRAALESQGSVGQGNDWLGIAAEASVTPAADAWIAPIETISNSEGGVERAYQGSALLLSQLVELGPGDRWSMTVDQRVRVDPTAPAIEAMARPRAAAGAASR